MKILSVDPGTTQSGVVLYDSDRREIGYALVADNEEVLRLIRNNVLAEQLVIEMVQSFGMAVGQEVFETVLWAGRFFQHWMDLNGGMTPIVPRLVSRMEVKMHLCHSQKANDSNIRQALIDKFGAPGTKKAPGRTYGVKSHCWPALAVAVVAAETQP